MAIFKVPLLEIRKRLLEEAEFVIMIRAKYTVIYSVLLYIFTLRLNMFLLSSFKILMTFRGYI